MKHEEMNPHGLPAPAAAQEQTSALFGAIGGLVMMGVGLLALLNPLAAGITLAYLITAGLGVYGASLLAAWAGAPAGRRDRSALVSGLLLTLLSLLALAASLGSPPGLAAMILGLSGAAALLTLFRGLTGFLLFGQLRRQKQEGADWVLVSGLLDTALGLMILASPVAGWFALSTLWGVYLGLSGGILLGRSLLGEGSRA